MASDPAPGHPGAEHLGAQHPGPRRVLVVDDQPDNALTIAALLELERCTVQVAHDGASALAIAEAFAPDVALLDLGLPVMDGFELARRLRDLPGLQGLRLLALTGRGDDEARERCAAAGFHAHLVKPVDFDLLLGAINSAPEGTAP